MMFCHFAINFYNIFLNRLLTYLFLIVSLTCSSGESSPRFTPYLTFFSQTIMKTLQKLTLAAFAILSAGAANAQQCVNCAPPVVIAPQGGGDPGCRDCSSAGPNSSSVRFARATANQPGPSNGNSPNSSTVFQQGTNQYACVEQIGRDNYATLIQNAGSAGAAGRNDAYQTQRNLFSFQDNVAYGLQTGTDNLMVQNQDGYDQYARARQTGNRNIAGQDQGGALGHGNSAYVLQTSSDNVSVQYQRGVNNTSDVYQHNVNGNWAGTTQLGTANTVAVNQH